MRFITPAAVLLVAGCATAPTPPPPVPPPPQVSERVELIGLEAAELRRRFGTPRFEVREGSGLKLQFARGSCVLDAYLYPPGDGTRNERVTHIDTRRPSGDDLSRAVCLAEFEAR